MTCTAMSAGVTRRNGKVASCEPCRKGKIRCDHQRPICSRCERRGIGSACIYHPAPLTKPRPPTAPSSSGIGIGVSTYGTPTTATTTTTTAHSSDAFSFALPPTSSASTRQADDDSVHNERLAAVQGLLSLLRHCSLIQLLVREYTVHAQAALVPSPIATAFADSLSDTVASYSLDDPHRHEDGIDALARAILHATATPVVITPDTALEDFTAQFTGANLRLQTLAVTYALTARSCLLGLARDDDKRDDLMHVLSRGCSTCIRMARDIAPDADDVSIWAAFEDARLATHLDGDSSPRVYRRLGELATDMYALGIHRESAITFRVPFYISECRRKSFVAAYQLDKFVATLMDRPPRILRRYSDCRVPLDLSDEELLSSACEEQALLKVTSDGWNAKGEHIPATWQRLRFQLGSFREEILEYRLRPSTPANSTELRHLWKRYREFYESLPAHLRYTPGCWASGLPIPVCLMLNSSRLNMLQGEFQIARLLELSDPASSSDLLCIAEETIATLLQVGHNLNRAIFLRHDFPYMALTYGLPTASRLAAALQNDTQSNSALILSAGLSRSVVIRNLSVYVSHLESVFSPTDGNYELCKQAAKSLSRLLDEILDSSTRSPLTPASTNSNVVSGQSTGGGIPSEDVLFDVDAFGMADHDILNGAGLEAFDLSTWAKNIEWPGGSWT